jgi:excisionase family DNA binding protein
VIKVGYGYPVARRREPEPADLITIAEAAKLLGVSVPTLRRWDESGKFPARRHPMNSYRMYARDEVERLRKKIVAGRAA